MGRMAATLSCSKWRDIGATADSGRRRKRLRISLRENTQRLLDTHIHVGPEKAVSYLPLRTVEHVIGITIQVYRSLAKGAGNHSMVFSASDCCIKSGAVYVYDLTSLRKVLRKNRVVLQAHGWPTGPVGFLKRIAREWLDERHPVMPVIREAFGGK
ncbi:MAG TPA: hypothetical protein VFA23_05710 [Dongiaceae bacterium]|nr:hypothetical protein [Dongiaceae bacterium]